MTSSPGTRRRAACLSLALLAWLPTSCAAPQPDACAAYLACFFPEGAVSPYVDVDDAGCPEAPGALCQAELADKREQVHALYGPTGECWRNGEGDPLYATCLNACLDAMREECRIAKDGSPREPHCVVGDGDARRFEPPADTSLVQSCVALQDG